MQIVPVIWDEREAIIYTSRQAENADSYTHLLVIPSVWRWRDMGKILGRMVPGGQYAYGYYALWDPDMGDLIQSLKDSLAERVAHLELDVFLERDVC